MKHDFGVQNQNQNQKSKAKIRVWLELITYFANKVCVVVPKKGLCIEMLLCEPAVYVVVSKRGLCIEI